MKQIELRHAKDKTLAGHCALFPLHKAQQKHKPICWLQGVKLVIVLISQHSIRKKTPVSNQKVTFRHITPFLKFSEMCDIIFLLYFTATHCEMDCYH